MVLGNSFSLKNLNSFYLGGEQSFYTKVNIGFAIDDGFTGLPSFRGEPVEAEVCFNLEKPLLNSFKFIPVGLSCSGEGSVFFNVSAAFPMPASKPAIPRGLCGD